MAYSGLSEFLEELLAAGQLARVTAPVDLDLELAEITNRVAAVAGPALVFDGGFLPAQPEATLGPLAVVTNLLGSEARACRAAGVASFASLAERMANVARAGGAPSWLDRLRGASDPAPQEKFRPKLVRQAACQQAVRLGRDVDLTLLPAARSWPGESGRWLSGRLLAAASLHDGAFASAAGFDPSSAHGGGPVAMRRARGVVLDRKRLLFSPIDLASSWLGATLGSPAPAAFVLGGDPAGLLAAAIDWTGLDAYSLAAMLRNQPHDVTPARSQPLMVPADAEMVIEGFFGPRSIMPPPAEAGAQPSATNAGSAPATSQAEVLRLADAWAGHYQDPQPEPWVFEVTAISHRARPVLPLEIVGDLRSGRPTGEAAVVQALRGALLRPMLAAIVPELVDVALPLVGGDRAMAVLAIRKQSVGAARRAASALWGLGPVETTKWVVVVDADVDVRNSDEVLARMAAHVSPGRDIFFHTGASDPHDHAAPGGLVARIGVDATSKWPPEHDRPWPERLTRPAEIEERVGRRWAEYGLKPLGRT